MRTWSLPPARPWDRQRWDSALVTGPASSGWAGRPATGGKTASVPATARNPRAALKPWPHLLSPEFKPPRARLDPETAAAGQLMACFMPRLKPWSQEFGGRLQTPAETPPGVSCCSNVQGHGGQPCGRSGCCPRQLGRRPGRVRGDDPQVADPHQGPSRRPWVWGQCGSRSVPWGACAMSFPQTL